MLKNSIQLTLREVVRQDKPNLLFPNHQDGRRKRASGSVPQELCINHKGDEAC